MVVIQLNAFGDLDLFVGEGTDVHRGLSIKLAINEDVL